MIRVDIGTLALACVVTSVTTYMLTTDYHTTKFEKRVQTLRADSERTLRIETEKVLIAERQAFEFKNTLEISHAQSLKEIDKIRRDNARLHNELDGLRDPGYRSGCSAPQAAGTDAPGSNSRTSSAGRLSDQASQFLLEFARDADKVAAYAMTCHLWATGKTQASP